MPQPLKARRLICDEASRTQGRKLCTLEINGDRTAVLIIDLHTDMAPVIAEPL